MNTIGMHIEREESRWECCLVRLSPEQEREVAANPDCETLAIADLAVISRCGQRHSDPDSRAACECLARLERQSQKPGGGSR